MVRISVRHPNIEYIKSVARMKKIPFYIVNSKGIKMYQFMCNAEQASRFNRYMSMNK